MNWYTLAVVGVAALIGLAILLAQLFYKRKTYVVYFLIGHAGRKYASNFHGVEEGSFRGVACWKIEFSKSMFAFGLVSLADFFSPSIEIIGIEERSEHNAS